MPVECRGDLTIITEKDNGRTTSALVWTIGEESVQTVTDEVFEKVFPQYYSKLKGSNNLVWKKK